MKEKTFPSPIFLVGFMASGKTSLGKKLAHKLAYQFIDLDLEIEKEVSATVNEIFHKKGEEYFRKLEIEVLNKIIKQKEVNQVVSLGGGTFCSQENVDFIKKNGLTFYLELELKNIIGRLKADKENRPLVKDLKEEELQKKVKNLFQSREQFYQQADFKIEAKKSKSKLVKEIIEVIAHQK